jgi:DNA-binding PadR family transcriptional regulator
LSPGALYASIKQLNEQGLIEEVVRSGDERRRYYQLTSEGREKLGAELEYYENTVQLAKQRQVLSLEGYYA